MHILGICDSSTALGQYNAVVMVGNALSTVALAFMLQARLQSTAAAHSHCCSKPLDLKQQGADKEFDVDCKLAVLYSTLLSFYMNVARYCRSKQGEENFSAWISPSPCNDMHFTLLSYSVTGTDSIQLPCSISAAAMGFLLQLVLSGQEPHNLASSCTAS